MIEKKQIEITLTQGNLILSTNGDSVIIQQGQRTIPVPIELFNQFVGSCRHLEYREGENVPRPKIFRRFTNGDY